MDLSLNYTSESSNIKTQNSQGQIGLSLGYNGKPYDLHVIADNKITVKIGNSEGYIQDIVIDTSSENDDDKYSGRFAIQLSDPNIQNLPPDIYYLEVWINTKDAQGNQQQLIFPSENVLPFTLTSNIVNGSNSMPMITYENIQKDWASFKNFVLQRYAEIQNDFAEMDDATNTLTNKVNSGISGYANFVGSAGSNLNSLADSGSAKLNSAVTTANSNVANIDNMVESAKAAIAEAKSGVYSVVDGDVNSAEADITNVTNSANTNTTNTVNSAETTINRAANGVTEAVDTTVNSAVTRVDSAADGIKGQVGSIVSSGQNDMGNVASNYNHMVYSTASMMFHTAGSFSNEIDSAVNNVKFTVNSADNNMSNFANDIDDRTSSADTHIDRDISNADNHADSTMNSVDDHADKDVSLADSHMDSTMNSADNHMSNFASDINDRTSSADAHIDTDVSDADSHIGSHVSNADNHIDYHTGSADSHIDNKVSSGDSYISENVNSGENRITNDVNTGEGSIVTTTNSAVGRINNDTSIVSSDATSVTNMAQKYSNNMNSQANSAYTNINNSGESVYNGINDSARNADNDINYSAKSAYTGVSASASSAYINIDGYNRSASDAISGDTSSGISAFNSTYNSASSVVQDTIDHTDNIIESDITNEVKSSVTDDFNNQAKSVQAQVVQTSSDVSTIQNNVTSLSNSTSSMAINVNNQANAHADSKASNLQDQITSNYLNGIEYRGNIHYWALDQELDIGIYSIPGYAIWDIPYNDNNAWYGSLIVLPGRDPSYKVQILIDDNNAGSGKSIINWRCVGSNINNTWHVEVDQDDLSNTFNQAKEYIDNKTNDLQNQITTNNNNHNGTESNLQNQIDQNKNDISTNALNSKVNLSPVTSVTSGGWGHYRLFTIPTIKGQRYSISATIDNGGFFTVDKDEGAGNNRGSFGTVDYNVNSWSSSDGTHVYAVWTEKQGGSLKFGFNNQSSPNDTHLSNICVTRSNDFVPFDVAQNNRENLINAVGKQGLLDQINSINDNHTNTENGLQNQINANNGSHSNTESGLQNQINANNTSHNNRENDLQGQINSHPNWGDENWTRNQANQAATNAMNQANAYSNQQNGNLQGYLEGKMNDLKPNLSPVPACWFPGWGHDPQFTVPVIQGLQYSFGFNITNGGAFGTSLNIGTHNNEGTYALPNPWTATFTGELPIAIATWQGNGTYMTDISITQSDHVIPYAVSQPLREYILGTTGHLRNTVYENSNLFLSNAVSYSDWGDNIDYTPFTVHVKANDRYLIHGTNLDTSTDIFIGIGNDVPIHSINDYDIIANRRDVLNIDHNTANSIVIKFDQDCDVSFMPHSKNSTTQVNLTNFYLVNLDSNQNSTDLRNKIDVLSSRADSADSANNDVINRQRRLSQRVYDLEHQNQNANQETAEAIRSISDALTQISIKTNDFNLNDDISFIKQKADNISNGMV